MYGIYCLKENEQSKGKTLKNKNKTLISFHFQVVEKISAIRERERDREYSYVQFNPGPDRICDILNFFVF